MTDSLPNITLPTITTHPFHEYTIPTNIYPALYSHTMYFPGLHHAHYAATLRLSMTKPCTLHKHATPNLQPTFQDHTTPNLRPPRFSFDHTTLISQPRHTRVITTPHTSHDHTTPTSDLPSSLHPISLYTLSHRFD